jgi:hypothetical protein
VARIRSVKPEFWTDRKMARSLSREARLFYIALWNQADEHGRLQGDPRFLKGQCFPYDDDLGLDDIDRLVDEVAASGRAVKYVVDGDPYLFLPKLGDHQRLEPNKVASRHPSPVEADEPAPRSGQSAPDPDEPAPGADVEATKSRVTLLPAPSPSAPRADELARGANEPALLYGAGSMEHAAGPPRTDDRAQDTGLLGSALLDEHLKALPNRPPRDVARQLGEQIDRLLDDQISADVIRQALERYRKKTGVGPGILKHLVNDIVNAPESPSSWGYEQ